jgi:hypothetical protein
MGYAPAQTEFSAYGSQEESLEFVKLAVAQGDRSGVLELGKRLLRAGVRTRDRGLELVKEAALLKDARAERMYDRLHFGLTSGSGITGWPEEQSSASTSNSISVSELLPRFRSLRLESKGGSCTLWQR